MTALFSAIDGLINPSPANVCELSSTSKWDEFATYFRDKITHVRLGISQVRPDENDDMCPSLPHKGTMDLFSLVDTDMLRKVILQLKHSTCLLAHIPSALYKTVFNCITKEVQAIVNHSLFTGTFPLH